MKNLLCFTLLLFSLFPTKAQTIEASQTRRPLAMSSLPPVEVTDDLQRMFIKQQWSPGTVVMKTSGITRQLPLLFDVYSNQLYYQQGGQVMEFLDPVQQFTLGLVRKNDSIQLLFRSGYPPVQKNTEATFYEVLVDGRYQLLRCKAKTIYLQKDIVPEEERSYNKELLYAALPHGKIVPIKKEKNFILEQLPEQATTIKELIDRHKLKIKTEEGLVQLFELLNG